MSGGMTLLPGRGATVAGSRATDSVPLARIGNRQARLVVRVCVAISSGRAGGAGCNLAASA